MQGWIDRLSPRLRHFLIALVAAATPAVIQYVTTNYETWGLPEPVLVVVGAVLPIIVLTVTKWSEQYGRGAVKGSGEADLGADGSQDA